MSYTENEITQLLHEWSDGDPEALDKLIPLVFEQVRAIARRYFLHEPGDHTLQPTALVNEVYLRLLGRRTVQWQNSKHFFGALAGMIRHILVDRARRHQTAKRGGDVVKIPLEAVGLDIPQRDEDLVALDDALKALAAVDPRKHQVVELKYFIGLTLDEIAEIQGVVRSTVIRDWANARAFLLRELKSTMTPGD